MITMVSHEKAYFVEDRNFSIPELEILIDAVQASSFITKSKTEKLIEKIASLAGKRRADILKRNMVYFNTRKHSNEKASHTIDCLEKAILPQRKLFFYTMIWTRMVTIFIAEANTILWWSPIALVFNEDNYYLTCYNIRHNSTSNYRVDHMDAIEIIDEPCCDKAVSFRNVVSTYTEQTLKMFSDRLEDMVLEFEHSLIGVVYDKFGDNAKMVTSGESKRIASVRVQISLVFWG